MRKILLLMLGTLLFGMPLLAQNRTVTGRITDASTGASIPNVSITIKNSTIGTTTGSDGQFSLNVPSSVKALVISSVGYQMQEISLSSKANYDVSLGSANEQLTEVVVSVPYGTIKKKAFTGSETTVTASSIAKQQNTNVTKSLEGLVAGILATNGGGAPGSGSSIVIRGFSSINGSSNPLYVLNGVPYDGSISAINSDDIESVTILKDAAASALYGSRAAGGVIMITTKTGRKGKPVVNANVRQGFMSRGIPEYDRLTEKDYYEINWEATRNLFQYGQGLSATQAGINASNQLTDASHLAYNAYNVPGNQLVDPATGKLNPNAQLLWHESWEDALFRTASRQNATVSVSGGADRSDYYLSAGYLNEEGTMRNTGYKRYNFRATINADATNWLRTGVSLDGAFSNNYGVINGGTATSNPFYYSRNMGPIYPVYLHDKTTGAYITDSTGYRDLDFSVATQRNTMGTRPYAANSNLLGTLQLDERSTKRFNGNTNSFAEVRFLRDFSLKANIGLNLLEDNGTTYQNRYFGDAQNVLGRLTKSFARQISYTFNQVLTWNHDFGGRHTIRALAGHENYDYTYIAESATKTGFKFGDPIQLSSATTVEGSPSSSEDHQRIESNFANVNYTFKDRYNASASVRRDGSSRFADSVRWGNFYSAGLGWTLSQEAFLNNVKWLNLLKLRASYGEVGQEDLGTGLSYPLYPYRDYYSFDGFGNLTPSNTVANSSLHWEKNRKFNVGVDFTLFRNRLQGTVEYFKNVSSDLLFVVPLYTSTGSLAVPQNIGSSTNKGIEVQLGYNVIRKSSFDWRIDLNVSHLKNVVTKLPPTQTEKGIVSGTKKISNGHSIFDFWLREFAGVDAATGDALYYKDVLDASGKATGQRVLTNVITQGSYYYFGSAIPDFNGGVTNSVRYKNFSFSFLTTFAYGGKFYDGNYAALMSASSYGSALHVDILKRWQKPGDVTNVPRVQNGNAATQEGQSSRFLFDGSFVNFKNVNLTYSLSSRVANRLHVSGLSVYGAIDNIYLISAKKGMDPQRAFNGTSDATYPPFRTITFGLNVNL